MNQSLSTALSLFLLHAEFHRSKLALASQSVTLDPSPGPLVSVLACGIQYTTCLQPCLPLIADFTTFTT